MNRTVQDLVLRPGLGWKCLGEPVWEHTSGTRIHWSGPIVRLPDMTMPPVYPDMRRLNTVIRANGGNRKRGVMAYALTLLTQNQGMGGSSAPCCVGEQPAATGGEVKG